MGSLMWAASVGGLLPGAASLPGMASCRVVCVTAPPQPRNGSACGVGALVETLLDSLVSSVDQ